MPRSRAIVFAALAAALAAVSWLLLRPNEEPTPAATAPTGRPASVDPASTASTAGTANTDTASQRIEAPGAASTAPTAASRGSLRVLVQWPPDQPAVDVAIYLRQAERGSPYAVIADGITSAEGVVLFADLPPGKAALLADRGDRLDVEITAAPQEVRFLLQDGVSVQGTVSAADGARVAGAAIWLQSASTDWSGCRSVATTDGNGAFALQHAGPGQSIGATAANFAPSKLVDLDTVDASKPPAVVALQLQPDGGSLAGTVTDASGRPIAGAKVAAGKRPRNLDHRGRQVVEAWTPRMARTDANGRFAIDGIASGTVPVAIQARGFGLWRTEVGIKAGETTTIQPQLLAAAAMTGTVTDGDGQPMADASISIYDRAPGTSFLAGGQIDFDETFGHVGSRSDAKGHYRVEAVTPGVAYAYAQRGGRRQRGDAVAHAYAEIDVAAGADTEWNPVITDGRTIEGVVLYRDGQPMPNVFMTLTDEQSHKQHVLTNDAAGVFRFVCLDASTYAVRVQYWDAPKGTPPLQQAGIVPDRGRVELRAPFDKPVKQKNGNVVGRIDDAAGRIDNPKAATVTLQSDKGWFRPGGKITDGAFRFDDVEPVRFRLALMQDTTAIAQSDWFSLEPAATLDTGVLRTTPGGAAKILVARQPGTESCEPKLYLRKDGFDSSTVVELGRAAAITAGNLTAGDYELTGYATGMMAIKDKFAVKAGETTEVRLSMQAGALCRFEVWFPEGSKSKRRTCRVLARDGSELLRFEGPLDGAPLRPYPLLLTLPIGEWKIDFSTDDGLAGTAQYTLSDLAGGKEPRIDLR